MLDIPSDHFSVTAVLLKKSSQHRWASYSWSFLGVMPGLSETQFSKAQTQGELHYYPELHLRLFRHYCENYYLNLMSEQAKIYFIGRLENDLLTPVLLTVDFEEAASYMEAGDQVLEAALPDELCVWLERFIIYHYAPEAPKKRRGGRRKDKGE
ncbi:DUF3305 domain-containing protein [Methylophaga nitratireducenticrescens]|uniref:Uncharacterized protein n=1 Tax=Methylophaga nitratireducenticrescens TaxID=754476 RepID=I1XH67_METNJ|nr:DUF3305 domain-containing protein [Methylophaga nitratireducenticrescens]AFI83736.1 hypothetical protein Q7A_894 [Methylophaga nitratireducenticrescens]AUZ83859.1 hypothetical protein CDW43_04415 [Methylophaga nitratireducenticrescens]